MPEISLPYAWEPRDYQIPFWRAMERGCQRALLCWHRRAGKDLTAFNWALFDMAVLHPGGQWWHVWPSYEQGRKGWWDGADNKGRRFLDYIPKELVKRRREDMMMLELVNGSIYRVVGGDDPDRLVGANPVGLIMTEYSLHNPAAWDYLRPILAANEGSAIFPFTPRGRNHAHELFVNVQDDPKWFKSLLSIEDTKALSLSVLDDERAAGMTEELIQQEYYCSFNAPMSGAYYAEQIKAAEQEGRIRSVPYDRNLEVETWWDLGRRDANAIWFVQRFFDELRVIDYEEASGKSLDEWVKIVREKPYIYSGHIAPHDIEVEEYSTGMKRIDYARQFGIDFITAPKLSLQEGIDIVRRTLPLCYFDEQNTFRGVEALKSYFKKWDEVKQVYSDAPVHNWASHGADAFRTGCISRVPRKARNRPKPKTKYDVFASIRRS
jgi:phage terminase large subunit